MTIEECFEYYQGIKVDVKQEGSTELGFGSVSSTVFLGLSIKPEVIKPKRKAIMDWYVIVPDRPDLDPADAGFITNSLVEVVTNLYDDCISQRPRSQVDLRIEYILDLSPKDDDSRDDAKSLIYSTLRQHLADTWDFSGIENQQDVDDDITLKESLDGTD